jgi:hypothetical protein
MSSRRVDQWGVLMAAAAETHREFGKEWSWPFD